jgi:hypothetical protein
MKQSPNAHARFAHIRQAETSNTDDIPSRLDDINILNINQNDGFKVKISGEVHAIMSYHI